MPNRSFIAMRRSCLPRLSQRTVVPTSCSKVWYCGPIVLFPPSAVIRTCLQRRFESHLPPNLRDRSCLPRLHRIQSQLPLCECPVAPSSTRDMVVLSFEPDQAVPSATTEPDGRACFICRRRSRLLRTLLLLVPSLARVSGCTCLEHPALRTFPE